MNILEKLGFTKKGNGINQPGTTQSGNVCPSSPLADNTPRKEGEKRIYNLIILDESGSMSRIREQALSGANETIQSIKTTQQENPDDNQMLSFVTFDSRSGADDVRSIIGCVPVEKVRELKLKDYQPTGTTPLYDAMGLSIENMRGNVKEGDNVLVTVITDGLENSSKIYSGPMIKEMVDGLRSQGWMFTYIGANQDSEEQAKGLGINASMDFQTTDEGTRMMYAKMNSGNRAFYMKSRAYRSGKMGMAECMDDSDFFSEKASAMRVTPDHIESLERGEIFVFGSNLEGQHAGGAARTAVERFGAIWGQGVGLQGQSYAIPTMQGGVETIRPYVNDFIRFASCHPEMKFLVTRIGCGIAGFSDEEIAPLFAGAMGLPNVYLPASFWKVINYKFKM